MTKVKNISSFDLFDHDVKITYECTYFNKSGYIFRDQYSEFGDYYGEYDDVDDYYYDYEFDDNGFCIPYLTLEERRIKSLDMIMGESVFSDPFNRIRDFWPNSQKNII